MQQQPLVLPLELSGSSAVRRGRAGDNRPDHDQQLLIMGVRTLETC
jgi:hypothetical protein